LYSVFLLAFCITVCFIVLLCCHVRRNKDTHKTLPVGDVSSEYRDLFNAFDRQHKGSLTLADLLAVAQQLGLPSNQADLDKLLAHANVNGIYSSPSPSLTDVSVYRPLSAYRLHSTRQLTLTPNPNVSLFSHGNYTPFATVNKRTLRV